MTELSSNGVVAYEVVDRIAWVKFNRPEKRNCMSPTLNRDMMEMLDDLEFRDDVGVLVLTGEGTAWSAGMDLKEYFRETEAQGLRVPARRSARATAGGVACAGIRSRRSRWSTAGASAAAMARCSPATWRSPLTRHSSACPRSTGASCRAAARPRSRSSCCRSARRCTTR